MSVTYLTHGRVWLALHELRTGAGRALLLLHGLGERSPRALPVEVAAWPGPVHALDFVGHGGSQVPAGGGYTAEVLMGDVDAAIAELGPVTVVGRGLGAYVALQIAGARPLMVRGAVLRDGPGLAGGGPTPGSFTIAVPPSRHEGTPDPNALVELAGDIRPPDYATAFVRQAVNFSGIESPLAVTCVGRPPWVEAVAAEVGVVECSLPEALALYAAVE